MVNVAAGFISCVPHYLVSNVIRFALVFMKIHSPV